MRYNDKELAKLGENKPELEGVLYHMRPQTKDWSDWYPQSTFKERYFKLLSNLLFYYRINEQVPLGVLVLENAQVAYERPHKGIPFAFSLTFKSKDNESKHIFSCRCDSDVNKWVAALKTHSYEYWRSQFVILQTKISMKTGQDPLLDYMKSKHSNTSLMSQKKMTKKEVKRKATFYSHVETSLFYESSSSQSTTTTTTTNGNNVDNNVGNLIDL